MQIAKKEQQLVLVWYVWLGHMQMFSYTWIYSYCLKCFQCLQTIHGQWYQYNINWSEMHAQLSNFSRWEEAVVCSYVVLWNLCYVIFTCASEHVFTNPLPCLYILVSEWSQCVWSSWEVRDMTMWNVGHLSRVPSSPWVCVHIPETEKVLTEACCSYMINRKWNSTTNYFNAHYWANYTYVNCNIFKGSLDDSCWCIASEHGRSCGLCGYNCSSCACRMS